MAHDFEKLVNQYIPAGQKAEYLSTRPHFVELLGKEVEDAVKDEFVKDALAFLNLLGTGINTEHHVEVENPVNDPASLVVPPSATTTEATQVLQPPADQLHTALVPTALIAVVTSVLAATPEQLTQIKGILGLTG